MSWDIHFSDVLQSAAEFATGFSNAWGSDNLLGAGRQEQHTTAGQVGAAFGDAAATVQGLLEIGGGTGGEAGGIALDATGVGAVAGVPINVASAGLIAHGAGVGLTGLTHLAMSATQSGHSGDVSSQPSSSTTTSADATEAAKYHRTEAQYEDLAKDPAHGGKIDAKSEQERRVGLELEARGDVPGPITRDPSGSAEFIDSKGNKWDVKGFNSNFSPQKGGFNLQTDAGKVQKSLDQGENVMLDTSKMKAEDIAALKAEGEKRGWGDRVRWWP